MDFRPGEEVEVLRSEVRAFVAEHLTTDMLELMERTGTIYDRDFSLAMGQRGWIAPGWPVEEGGAGYGALQQTVLGEELHRAQAPIDAGGTTMLVANTIRALGTPEQKAAVLRAKLLAAMKTASGRM